MLQANSTSQAGDPNLSDEENRTTVLDLLRWLAMVVTVLSGWFVSSQNSGFVSDDSRLIADAKPISVALLGCFEIGFPFQERKKS